jgi:hypothetical protein
MVPRSTSLRTARKRTPVEGKQIDFTKPYSSYQSYFYQLVLALLFSLEVVPCGAYYSNEDARPYPCLCKQSQVLTRYIEPHLNIALPYPYSMNTSRVVAACFRKRNVVDIWAAQ